MSLKVLNELENSISSSLKDEKDIIETLSKRLGYSKKIIKSKSRRQEIVRARHLIAYLLREYGSLSYPAIGRLLGDRDHTTAMYAYTKMKRNIEMHPYEFKDELEDLSQEAKLINKRRISLEKYKIPKISAFIKAKKVHPMTRKVSERNLKILELWKEGLTLQSIANVFDVTRERIRQITISTIKQLTVNESISRGIIMDSDLLVEEESNKRRILQDSKKIKMLPIKKEKRWSRYYIACRLCNTTSMPHSRHGFCERCSGQYKGKRRENIIELNSNNCGVCEISRSETIKKYGKDFYITKSQKVLCRSCFLKFAGEKMGNRIRQSKK